MSEYFPSEIEARWQKYWASQKTFAAKNASSLPKYYVLDMFPYPSGAGLHVGHPLGYIASDIYARYKRHKGFNVLHPMGYDSFGLPAEQYAIQTGQHPAITTKENIARYRGQLDQLGFSFDWDREVRTSDPEYYRWTQWIFIQLFHSWYNPKSNKAEPIQNLISDFDNKGWSGSTDDVLTGDLEIYHNGFTAQEWKEFSEATKEQVLQKFRLAYLSETMVNWCPQLGTVLANEEVKDGVSERGGFPVERKLMKQWSLRITAYADRLLNDLEGIDWTESIKEAQRNWIGKSSGASVFFQVENSDKKIEVFTTRPDTIFGVSFLTMAPEHDWVKELTSDAQRSAVEQYVDATAKRSERERMADVKKVSGVFTGAYALHPFSGKKIPVWIGDYVLAGYGTGAVMAVPAHDSRDYAFAKHFSLPILQVVEGGNIAEEAWEAKEGKIINSQFLDGLEVKKAIAKAIEEIEKAGHGKGKTLFRLRDAIFGRQRYWGEPIPVYYKDGIPHTLEENELPLTLPEVDKFLPTEDGEPPLARAKDWKYKGQYEYETTTMPGWAGSSWYFLRYMDAKNQNAFASKEVVNYWQQVDLYLGGSEHATGHLLYVRFWTKFLYDLGLIPVVEPAKKLINQGMIQGVSSFVYRSNSLNSFISYNLIKDQFEKMSVEELEVEASKPNAKSGIIEAWKNSSFHRFGKVTPLHVDVNIVENNILNIEAFKNWREEYKDAKFVLEDGKYICGSEVEKMSKSKWNVVSPDLMVEKFGADCLRMYEMFLGPLELSKPWNTNGITGVSSFLKKLWRLFHATGSFTLNEEEPTANEWKILHKTIKKITEDIERFSFNTSVSSFMICVNELQDVKCNKRKILEPLIVLISPYAPHIAEELWALCEHEPSVAYVPFPTFEEKYLVENEFEYPLSINGKTKGKLLLPLGLKVEEIQERVLASDQVIKLLNGKSPKKVIIVPGKIVNLVIA